MARATSYREAGADCLHVPEIADAEAIGRLVKQVGAPVNVVAGPLWWTESRRDLWRLIHMRHPAATGLENRVRAIVATSTALVAADL